MSQALTTFVRRAALSIAVAVVSALTPGAARAAVLLEVDLSVTNQITISATTGASSATTSGSTTTGFYLADFFGTNTLAAGTVGSTTGDLTSASQGPDNSPLLFTLSGADRGLNVWSYTASLTTTFTAGSPAFTGSLTSIVPPDVYAAALAGPGAGDIYFAAEDATGITGATLLGTWSLVGGPSEPTVPEP